MEYEWTRSKRKTIAVSVNSDGIVMVRSPNRVGRREVEAFLSEKESWIQKQQARVREIQKQREAFSPKIGETLPFLGQECPVCAAKRAAFSDGAFGINPALPAKEQLIKIYRQLAKNVLGERVSHYAEIVGVTPEGFTITSAKTRFGSCSGKNRLSFPWKLSMAPLPLIDYVVVHELCHIREHNHSAGFWALVERFLPDYRERERGLKAFALKLACQNWDH